MEIYQPAEDSAFLSEIMKQEITDKNIKVLDLGTGSGIQSKTLILLGIPKKNILAIDINPDALRKVKSLGIQTLNSNLLSNTKEKFDLIVFNPPYLPESEFDSNIDTTGGKQGDEIILQFIKQLPSHLTSKGKCLLLTSSLTPDNKWIKLTEDLGLTVTKIATKKIFFEELYVWVISPQ